MQEIDKRIGLLRLLIADIDSREQHQSELARQYASQRHRIVEATVYHAGDLSQALHALREVEERLGEVQQASKHLELIRVRASTELEALMLTRRVAEAKSELSQLEARQQDLSRKLSSLGTAGTLPDAESAMAAMSREEQELRELNEQVQAEIERLHKLIHDASQRAAHNVTLK